MSAHKNRNEKIGNFVIYAIFLFGRIFKFGKADADKICKKSRLPLRLHTQLKLFWKLFGTESVFFKIFLILQNVTVKEAKQAEQNLIRDYYNKTGQVPPGNEDSFKP
jgi:hypothetical protein